MSAEASADGTSASGNRPRVLFVAKHRFTEGLPRSRSLARRPLGKTLHEKGRSLPAVARGTRGGPLEVPG